MDGLFVGHPAVTHHVGGVAADVDGVADRLADISLRFGCYNIINSTSLRYNNFPRTNT
jgi:hypothetical protein